MNWCWSWSSNTLATWCEELALWKDPDTGKDWRQEEKGMTEDETVGWHHWLNEHEFEQALGDGEGQGSLARCSPRGHKESNRTEWLSNKNKGFLGGSVVKNLLANVRNLDSIPQVGKIPSNRKWQPTQYSCLENPMDKGAWQATVQDVARIRPDWVAKNTQSSAALRWQN